MCQIKSEGGRRCAIHRHDSKAAIKVVIANSGLTQDQAEKLFSDLRREGRNRPTLVQDVQWRNALRNLNSAARTPELRTKVRNLIALATNNSGTPDGATLYAMQRIVSRAQEQAVTLNNVVESVAEKAGLNNAAAKEQFKADYTAVDRKRNAEVPAEFTKTAVAKAKAAGIPQDVSTVVAVEKLKVAGERGPRRITRVPVHGSAFLHEIGYDVDGGRLEVVFKAHPDRPVAYRNVPEDVWDRMNSGRSAGSIYSNEVRGNMDYQYPTGTAAEEDAYTVRCGSCGQFRASAHSCPTREIENKLAAKGLSSTAVKALAVMPDVNVDSLDERSVADIEREIAVVRSQIEDNNVEIAIKKHEVAEATVAYEAALAARAEQDEVAAVATEEVTPVVVEKTADVAPLESIPVATATEERHGAPAYVVTVEAQRNPVRFQYNESQIITGTVYCSGFIKTGKANAESNLNRHRVSFMQYLSDADKAAIEAGGVNDSFLIAYTISDEGNAAKIVRQYDFTEYRVDYSNYWSDDNNKHYKLLPLGRPPVIEKHTYEEATALRDAENKRLAQAIANGTAVRVESNNTMTRKYKVDGNLDQNQRMTFAKVVDLRAAIKDGKVAVFNLQFEHSRRSHRTDDQGVAYQPDYAYTETVSGDVAVRKNADGVIEMVNKQSSLQCNCYKYRQQYHCEHVDYVQRHIGNAVQQALPAERTHRLLTSSLSGRGDITVIENDPKHDTYISFGTEAPGARSLGSNRGNRATSYHGYHYRLPAEVNGNSDTYTPEQLTAVTRLHETMRHLNVVAAPPNSAGIRQALARADVQIPIRAEYANNRWDNYTGGDVTGTMILAKTRDDVPTVKSHDLKCTCAEYQEKYDCEHIRNTLSQPQVFTHINVRNYRPADEVSLEQFLRVNSQAIRSETNIVNEMVRENITREEAVIRIREQEERARLERERHDRDREERHRRYEEENRERLRLRAIREEEEARFRHERIARENAHLKPAYEQYRAGQIQRWEEKDETYEANPAAFYEAHQQALARNAKGLDAIPYKMENVTDGICADTPGARKFGIELEFDIKRDVNRAAALRKIGQELHAAGLTTTARQVGYHTAANNGWASWSFEEDCTVDAELVSPILSDTPESWKQIAQVTEIIERNGGYASTRCGSHVHVSTGSYGLSTAKHAELLRTMNQNEDALYRLAANPATGKHRGTRWCAPNSNDNENDISDERQADHGVLAQYGHALALNFEAAGYSDFNKRNVEFRMWDGSISASAIQQQIKVSAAITDYAERQVEITKKSEKPKEARQKIGHNRKREADALAAAGVTKHTAETFKETNAGVASLLDKLFRKNEDKEGVAALFALTNWQQGNNN